MSKSLFDPEQPKHLRRVSGRIAGHIMLFLARLSVGDEFTLSQLQSWVASQDHGAPDSPSRVLRDLRQCGRVRYSVVSRRSSRYRFEGFTDGRE